MLASRRTSIAPRRRKCLSRRTTPKPETANARLFFVGADSYAQGTAAGERMCQLDRRQRQGRHHHRLLGCRSASSAREGFQDALKKDVPDLRSLAWSKIRTRPRTRINRRRTS
jgi:hypothetical protein